MKKRMKEGIERFASRYGKKTAADAAQSQERREEAAKAPLFTAGGKMYVCEKQLMAKRLHEKEQIYEDCYGRMVLRISERYPTFDSYDALYENRYFHYYYIQTEDGFTCVRTADDQPEIRVREGISAESLIWERGTWHWELLEAAGLAVEE